MTWKNFSQKNGQTKMQSKKGVVHRMVTMNNNRGQGFAYLPGSKTEVKMIENHLRKIGFRTKLYTDGQSSETVIKSLSANQNKSSPGIIHISTHGYYFPQVSRSLSNDLTPVEQNRTIYRLSDNPLLRTGLAFAGANHVWRGGEPIDSIDDGILTAYEVSNMNLFNTKLVVLSACKTGLGDINDSEGVYGLQRAFRLAGVQTLIVSLWEVPDKETVELMTEFYTQWGNGNTMKNAFNKAQIKMRHTYPDHPEKWAGFVMIE